MFAVFKRTRTSINIVVFRYQRRISQIETAKMRSIDTFSSMDPKSIEKFVLDKHPCLVQKVQPFGICIMDPVTYQLVAGLPVLLTIILSWLTIMICLISLFNAAILVVAKWFSSTRPQANRLLDENNNE